jgi:NAD(P)-dependent dehydrogenase (short-subunit alcohol dehydrogenase family)
MKDLQGKTAVVTGGGSGIGRALALAFAAEGMKVVVGDIETHAANTVADEVRARGKEALAAWCDVSHLSSVQSLAEQAYERFGAVHVLCNNAGVVALGKPLAELKDPDWRWTLSVNLDGVAHGIEAFVPRMLAQVGEGHIVNTASIAGLVAGAGPGIGIYTASKYGVVGLSETLRAELAETGIGVSVLCPGGVATRIAEAERNRPEEFGGPTRTEPLVGMGNAMDPAVVAEKVVAGIKENRLYILTHPETKGLVEARFRAIMAAYE